jgi:DNA-binding response OmpR family regulator
MGKKVLIVEDDVGIRELYGDLLKEAGYEVAYAGDGDEAVQMIYRSDWDILLLDIMLPRLDGVNVLKRINADNELGQKPVLVVTNLNDEKLIKECMALGAKEYIVKSSMNPDEIAEKVGKYDIPVE